MTRNRFVPAALAAAMLTASAAAPALAAMKLPEASKTNWTAHKVEGGSIAQINARGEGRFAVMCEKGDRKGSIFYRVPMAAREEVRAAGDRMNVVFTFDKDEKIERTMSWDQEGRYWTDPFGPNSTLAELMKKSYDVRINVKGHPGVDSEFTLKDSWKSIEAMFAGC